MRNIIVCVLFVVCAICRVQSTCVLESEFGFTLNCAFKKSGLFRVRNLGGIKAHVGLGFSVGDELGFKESLSNLEGNRRRSVNARNGQPTANNLPNPNTRRGITVRQPTVNSQPTINSQPQAIRQVAPPNAAVPVFKPLPPAADQRPVPEKLQIVSAMPYLQLQNYTRPLQVASVAPNLVKPVPALSGTIAVPAFQAMPSSVSRISTGPTVLVNNNLERMKVKNSIIIPQHPQHSGLMIKAPIMGPLQQNFDNQIVSPAAVIGPKLEMFNTHNIQSQLSSKPHKNEISNTVLPNLEFRPDLLLNNKFMGHSIQELAQATNISVEAIQAAILIKQKQLLKQQQPQVYQTTTTTTTTTTTPRPAPTRKYPQAVSNKVMNAPKEYYPVGYDKNFDDNFSSRVELPDTSFYCGDQKHFPGLYADEDLGCMVFHVCALTDDGLIMKSFLCPESTLFDQTVLRCNWWFYVDCKASKGLYDSNIPVSKSYQLMKALAFFSSYKKDQSSTNDQIEDIQAALSTKKIDADKDKVSRD